jgi:hypothetical protein
MSNNITSMVKLNCKPGGDEMAVRRSHAKMKTKKKEPDKEPLLRSCVLYWRVSSREQADVKGHDLSRS